VWLLVFLPNMLAKERSMSRYPTWDAYCDRTGMLFPSPCAACAKLCGGGQEQREPCDTAGAINYNSV
jgi:hypothetical protein